MSIVSLYVSKVRKKNFSRNWKHLSECYSMLKFGITGEFGFVTESMKEGLYEKKVSDYTEDIISMIRVED